MRINDYSVTIRQGQEIDSYVFLEYKKQYTISLRNFRFTRCDAIVKLDSKNIGTFRLNPYERIELERPVNDNRKFTFYIAEKKKAKSVGIKQHDPDNGLIEVTFIPEIYMEDRPIYKLNKYNNQNYTYSYNVSTNTSSSVSSSNSLEYNPNEFDLGNDDLQEYKEGGSGLSGNSNRELYSANNIQYDYSQQTVIYLILIGKTKKDKRIRPINTYSVKPKPLYK